MTPPLVRACIFDVDGLLINSEDIYTQQYNNVLRKHGAPDLPWSLKALVQSTGQEGAQRIIEWANLPLTTDEWADEVKAHRDLFRGSQPMPGAPELLDILSRRTSMHLAIASSSNDAAFELKTSHLPSITEPIPKERRVFGNDADMAGKRKKPAPHIFLIALKRLNESIEEEQNGSRGRLVQPEECLVFEDSFAGVEAARSAGMQVVWVPHPKLREVARGHELDVLRGAVAPSMRLMHPESINKGASSHTVSTDDGFAAMLHSLRDFKFERYGIILSSHKQGPTLCT